jgi:hypothetical protein
MFITSYTDSPVVFQIFVQYEGPWFLNRALVIHRTILWEKNLYPIILNGLVIIYFVFYNYSFSRHVKIISGPAGYQSDSSLPTQTHQHSATHHHTHRTGSSRENYF